MGKKFLPSAVALLGGAAGFALRKWQLNTAFEADTGLAIPGAAATTVLVAFSLLVVLLLLPLCRGQEKTLTWDKAFANGRGNAVFATALLLGAILLLGSAGLEVMHFSENAARTYAGETRVFRIVSRALLSLRILLCLGSLPAVFLWTRAIFRGEGGTESLASLVPCLLCCLWLISDYQLRSADPVVMDYVYEVFAIVTILLGLYYIAGHAFGNGRPRRALYFCLLGAYFSLVTLADPHSMTDLLRYGFAVIYLSAHAILILTHPPVEEAPAEPEREADENA